MVWYVIAAIAFALALFVLIFNYMRDRRYLRKRVLDAMSPSLREEIEKEREEAMERRERFREVMGEAMEREGGRQGPPHDALP